MIDQAVRDFYAEPGLMSRPGDYAALIDELPDDVGQLVRIIHGLVPSCSALRMSGVCNPARMSGWTPVNLRSSITSQR